MNQAKLGLCHGGPLCHKTIFFPKKSNAHSYLEDFSFSEIMLYSGGEPLFPMYYMGLLAKELRFLNMKQVPNNIKNNHCIVQCVLQVMNHVQIY
jgi:hypothetical protein